MRSLVDRHPRIRLGGHHLVTPEHVLRWHAEHPERVREIKRNCYVRNKEKQRVSNRIRAREKYASDPEYRAKQKAYRLANKKSLNNTINRWRLERREHIAERPCPKYCELCGRQNQRKGHRLHFDHDHATGNFRGWLCSFCNNALGFAQDNPALVRRWADYLEQGGFGPGPANKTVDAVLRSIESVSY